MSDEEEEHDDVDIPEMPAPAPSPWERQSHLGKLAVNLKGDDSHSHHSVESEGSTVRPPSYHYVMAKGDPKSGSTDRVASPSSLAMSHAAASTADNSGSRDSLNHPRSKKSYIETTC